MVGTKGVQMKIQLDQNYLKKIKYFTLGFVIIYVCYQIIGNIEYVVYQVKNLLAYVLHLLAPFLWGCVIAYLLLPIVKWMERMLSHVKINKKWMNNHHDADIRMKRIVSIIAAFIFIIGIIVLLIYGMVVMIGGSLSNFNLEEAFKYFENYADQFANAFTNIESQLENLGLSTNYAELINRYSIELRTIFENYLHSMILKGGSFGKSLINFIFGFIFAVNLLLYREYFAALTENFLRLIMTDHKKRGFEETIEDIHHVLLGFLRGQVIDLTFMSLVTSGALLIIGYPFAFMLGIFAGYTNIVPYIGSWVGAFPAIIIGMANGGIGQGIFGYIYILVIQQIYITFVTPKIQGDHVGIHPMFVLLSLTIFGSIFGLVGMILAIPIAGIIRIFILKWVKYRSKKKEIQLIDSSKEL